MGDKAGFVRQLLHAAASNDYAQIKFSEERLLQLESQDPDLGLLIASETIQAQEKSVRTFGALQLKNWVQRCWRMLDEHRRKILREQVLLCLPHVLDDNFGRILGLSVTEMCWHEALQFQDCWSPEDVMKGELADTKWQTVNHMFRLINNAADDAVRVPSAFYQAEGQDQALDALERAVLMILNTARRLLFPMSEFVRLTLSRKIRVQGSSSSSSSTSLFDLSSDGPDQTSQVTTKLKTIIARTALFRCLIQIVADRWLFAIDLFTDILEDDGDCDNAAEVEVLGRLSDVCLLGVKLLKVLMPFYRPLASQMEVQCVQRLLENSTSEYHSLYDNRLPLAISFETIASSLSQLLKGRYSIKVSQRPAIRKLIDKHIISSLKIFLDIFTRSEDSHKEAFNLLLDTRQDGGRSALTILENLVRFCVREVIANSPSANDLIKSSGFEWRLVLLSVQLLTKLIEFSNGSMLFRQAVLSAPHGFHQDPNNPGLPSAEVLRDFLDMTIRKLLPITGSELEMWDNDPQQLLEDQLADVTQHMLRPSVDLLLLTIVRTFPQQALPAVRSLLQQFLSPSNDPPQVVSIVHSACLHLVGLLSGELESSLDFEQFFWSTIVADLRITDPCFKIVRREFCQLMIEDWKSSLSTESFCMAFEKITEMVETNDFVLALWAAIASRHMIDCPKFRIADVPIGKYAMMSVDCLSRLAVKLEGQTLTTQIVQNIVKIAESSVHHSDFSLIANSIIQSLVQLYEHSKKSHSQFFLRAAIYRNFADLLSTFFRALSSSPSDNQLLLTDQNASSAPSSLADISNRLIEIASGMVLEGCTDVNQLFFLSESLALGQAILESIPQSLYQSPSVSQLLARLQSQLLQTLSEFSRQQQSGSSSSSSLSVSVSNPLLRLLMHCSLLFSPTFFQTQYPTVNQILTAEICSTRDESCDHQFRIGGFVLLVMQIYGKQVVSVLKEVLERMVARMPFETEGVVAVYFTVLLRAIILDPSFLPLISTPVIESLWNQSFVMFVRDSVISRNVLLAMYSCPPLRENRMARESVPHLLQSAFQLEQTYMTDEMYDRVFPLNYLARLYQDLWTRDPVNSIDTMRSVFQFFSSSSISLPSLPTLMPSTIQRTSVSRSS